MFAVLTIALFCHTGDPSVVAGVSVITGDFSHHTTDHVIEGPVPYPITHGFSSYLFDKYQKKELYPEGSACSDPRWKLFPHLFLVIDRETNSQSAYLREASGEIITFRRNSYGDYKELLPIQSFPSYGDLSGRESKANYKLEVNNRLGFAILSLPNGGKRY